MSQYKRLYGESSYFSDDFPAPQDFSRRVRQAQIKLAMWRGVIYAARQVKIQAAAGGGGVSARLAYVRWRIS